jgi:hypothetical protein
MTVSAVARAAAIVIAIAAIIDPAIPMTRPSKPVVSVVAASAADTALASRVRDRLDDAFAVIDAPFGGANATVIVGNRLTIAPAAPVFAVLPGRTGRDIRIESVRSPGRVTLESAVSVRVGAHVTGAAGRTVILSLMAGALELDRVEHVAASDDERFDARVAFVPIDTGAAHLRVTARVDEQSDAADRLVDVRTRRLSVLFHDARPSWLSTFVRRTVERDPRFLVTSRTITSREISIDAGRPVSPADARALAVYDAVIVGAPESLSAGEVAALDEYMRTRAGAVVLPIDHAADGPWFTLAGVDELTAETVDAGVRIVRTHAIDDAEAPALVATQLLAPASLPNWVSAIAVRDDDAAPVIWRSAVGAGRLIASGALDAWRFRDAADSDFDSFWPALIAQAASASPPAVDVRIVDPVVSPGSTVEVTATFRDVALAPPISGDTVAASVRAALDGPGGRRTLRLWPDRSVGRFSAVLRAPNEPGTYRVIVSNGVVEADAALIVAANAAAASPEERDLVATWARAHGGEVFGEDRVANLPAALLATLEPAPRRIIARPMRSAWWIVPFVLALGAEWWWRRRRGLA